MARWIGTKPEFDIEAVLSTAKAWHERCCLDERSMFGEENLWTLDLLRKLQHLLVEGAIAGTKLTFFEKLQQQLKNAEASLTHLAAEVYWFYCLFPARVDLRPATKKRNVKLIWEWSGRALPESEFLADDALVGVARTGVPYKAGMWKELKFLLQVICQWKEDLRDGKIPPDPPPFELADWLDRTEGAEIRPMRHILLYLVCPDSFERIVSKSQKGEIVQAFQAKRPASAAPVDKNSSSAEIDRALYDIRKQLEKEHDTAELDFHRPPLKDVWSTPSQPPPPQPLIHRALNAILYGPPGTGKTYATARRCVEICDGLSTPMEDCRERYRHLVNTGRVEFVTFHQTYGYEEFVEGLRPETGPARDGSGDGAGFRVAATNGILKRIAGRARKSTDFNHVLVIDEINRANVSKVMGEVITLLEEDKRQGAPHEVCVTLPHSGEHFTLPPNLYIVGTMNTADRSIALLDTALRRRFEFEELAPDVRLLEAAADATGVALPDVLQAINERLEWLIDRDHLIGHAWLMGAKSRDDVDQTMLRKIIPLIAEYFYDDWEKVRAVLGGTDDFVQRDLLSPPPGLGDSAAPEPRYRWRVRGEFPADAYARLIGKSVRPKDAEVT